MKRATNYILAIVLVISITTVGALSAVENRQGYIYTGPKVDIIDNVTLKTPLPTVPKDVFILKIDNKNIDNKSAKKIAEDLLGQGTLTIGSQMKNRNGTALIDLNNERAVITVNKHGQFKYMSGKEWSGKYRKDEMLDEKQAKNKAMGYINNFVEEGVLAKKDVDPSKLDVVYDEGYVMYKGNGTIDKFVSNQHVNLNISHNDIPLRGGGAKVRLYLGKNGETTGLLNFVGNLTQDKKVSVITPQQAIDKLKSQGYKNIDIDSMTFVYYVPPVDENADFIYPVYDIQGKIHSNGDDIGFAIMIPATS